MTSPTMLPPRAVGTDTVALPATLPVPGFGVLAINAFVLQGPEPVLIDTGLAGLRADFMTALRAVMAPSALRWIWVTHTDPDHVGNLEQVLAEAPRARVITTFVGMAKMGLLGLPLDRVMLLNPGQTLDAGGRVLEALRPPTFDAPETTAIFEAATRTLFSADCFGALLPQPYDAAADIPGETLRDGVIGWARIDAPWLPDINRAHWAAAIEALRRYDAQTVLSSHLPPAQGITARLIDALAAAPEAPPFVGPDQAALEAMMRAA